MKKSLVLAAAMLAALLTHAQSYDPDFNTVIALDGTITTGIMLDDGSYIAGGEFDLVGTTAIQGIVKFNSDGTIDNTFQAHGKFRGKVSKLVLQPDGKIIVAGDSYYFYDNQELSGMVVRLNADGTVDNTFSAYIIFTSAGTGLPMKIQTDGKIIIAHTTHQIDGSPVTEDIIRLNSNGTRDLTFDAPDFSGNIHTLDIQADGKVIAGGQFTTVGSTTINRIVRLDTNGSIDNTFDIGTGFNNQVNDVKVINTDRILVTGSFSSYKGSTMVELVALKNDGTVDGTFTGNGKLFGGGSRIGIQTDGKIVLVGTFFQFNSIGNNGFIRLLSDGTLDAFAIGTGPDGTLSDISINSADEMLVTGASFGDLFRNFDGQPRHNVAVLNSNGSLKTTAYNRFYTNSGTRTLLKQGADKILMGHAGNYVNDEPSGGLARLNLDGTLDATFNNTGANNDVISIVIDNNNKIVIGGLFTSYSSVTAGRIARLDADGNLDATFNTNTGTGFNNSVSEVKQQSDGKLIVAGSFTAFNGTPVTHLARLNTDGTLDGTFHSGTGFTIASSFVRLETMKVLPDNKILIGGRFDSYDGHNVKALIRLKADGTFDETFNIGAGFSNALIYDIEVLDDGKLLIGGSFDDIGGVKADFFRLNSDGTLDTDFDGPFLSGATTFARQDDGKILVHSFSPGIRRLYADGTLDETFAAIGATFGNSLVSFDKEIIVGASYFIDKIVLPDDPAAPTTLAANAGSHTTVSLTWADNASNEDGYKIERSTPDNTNYETLATLGANITAYEDNTLQETTTYYYRVSSFNAGSENHYSNEVMITTPPAAPSDAIVTANSTTELVISWTDNSGSETGFEVERSTGDALNFTPLTTTAADVTEITDAGLTSGTTYFYRIRAANGTNYSPFTDPVSGVPAVAAPSALTLDSPDGATVVLTWTDNSTEETEFIVKRSTGNELNYEVIATLPADTETYSDPRRAAETTYYYSVSAASANSESPATKGNITTGVYIMSAGNLTTCNGVFYDPGAQGNYASNLNITSTLAPSTTGASIQVEFTSFSTEFFFDALSIYDGTDVNAPLIGIFDSNDDPGTIRATNPDGALTFAFQSNASTTSSGWRALISCHIVPFEPTTVDVEPVNTSHVKVTWTDNSDNETGFVVERSVNNASSFNTIADLPPNATFYDDNDVTSNTTFYYRVKAKGNDTDSDFAPMTAIAYGEGIWKLKADFDGIARTDATAFAIDGKGYLGLGWAGGAQANNFRAFDPATNTWSVIDSYGGSIRSEAAAFVIGSKAYVGTGEGFDLENDLWEYDPSLNDWIAKADFGGTARRDAVGFSINGKGYIGLGTDASGRTSDVWQYDPAGNAWTEVAPFPGSARTGAVAFVINDIAYVGTGSSSSGNTNDFWKYDAGSNTWTAIAAFPGNARRHAVAFALNNKGYVGTGESASDHDDFWEYDPATDTWREVVSFGGGARYVASSFATSAHGYVGTGFDGSNRKDLWEFTMTDVPAPPAAPEQLAATVISNTEISLTWQYTGNATGFILERSIGGEAAYTVIAEPSATATSYVDTGLNPMTAYYYRIKAVYPSGNSPFSASANATTFPEPPDAPSGLEAFTVTYSIAWLRWVDNSFSENEFVIERSENTADNFETIETVSINATEFGDQTVKAKTVYHYRVKAVNSGGSSGYSNTITITTADPPVLAPSNLTAVATNTAIALTWDDNSNNETGFYIFRSATDTDNFVYLASVTSNTSNTTSYRDSNVEENITYYYRVRAASNDYETDFSNIASATRPLSIPFPPSALTAQLNETDDIITLSWTSNSENHDDFVIERSFDGTNFSEHGTSTTTDYQDSDFGDAVKTYYRVLARNGAGNSAYSNTATVIITGIEGATLNDAVTVSPNPADHHIFVEFSSPESGNVQVELSDITGKVISKLAFEKPEVQFTQRIDVVKPSGGIMLMKISLNKMTAVKKVIFK